ncbi:hypothetical protein HK097_007164 [Rhizophlyctis rosea]|uniref:Major facilitator superfamily (MFS) profile domain-containing protein n=1 Tax=Rhizophlyctis rosea TaxID=64517 RepID=A0AAD5SBZ6_9FUNG|nr:hypothetical protein HK097_007164 [Rhizophlyctis rosea]
MVTTRFTPLLDQTDTDEPLNDHPEPHNPSTHLVFLSFFAALGGFLSGYDTGIISGATLFITTTFALTPLKTSLIVSGVILGAILGSLLSTRLTDTLGRKKAIFLGSIIFILGAFIMALSPTWEVLLFGRIVAGAAIGLSAAVPIYIAELSPPAFRGRLVNITPFCITLGQLVSYLTAYSLSSRGDWRTMLGLAAVPALIQCVGVSAMPESPRYLVQIGRMREAMDVLKRVREGVEEEEIEAEVEAIRRSVGEVKREQLGIKEMWDVKEYRKGLIVAAGLHILQQFSGINTIMYYSATILRLAGFTTKSSAILFSTFIALSNCIGTLSATWIVDSLGRRKLLLWSMVPVFFMLICLSGAFRIAGVGGDIGGDDGDGGDGVGTGTSWIALGSLVVYVFAYAIGLGCVPWLVMSEIFPLEIRGKGAGFAIAANWISNLLISLTFLTVISLLTPSGAFVIYAVCVIAGWAFVHGYVPETKGKALEDTDVDGGGLALSGH